MIKNKFLLLIILISLLPLFNIFKTSDLIHTHDGLAHLPRIASYYKALGDGQFPVRWAGDLNYGYGMPLFNFIYQTPYLISSLFIFLGFNLVNSFKLTLSLSYVLSGIFMFLFVRELTKDDRRAFFVTILYQFAPFRLIELLVRGSLGEVYTYVFLPLVLYGILKFFRLNDPKYLILSSISSGLLVISHNSVSFMFFAVILFFLIFFAKSIKNFIYAILSLFIGTLLSAFYWIPAIFEHKFTYGDLYMKNIYKDHFVDFYKFIIPNFTNSPSLRVEGIVVHVGIVHTFIVFFALWILLSKREVPKQIKNIIIFSISLIVLSFLSMQKISSVLWENLSLLRQFQFPWRALSVVTFSASLLGIPFMNYLKLRKTAYWFLIFFIVVSTIPLWKANLGYNKINENYYWNFPLTTTYYGETDVIWSAGPAKSYPKQPVEFAVGGGEVSNYSRKSQVHSYTVEAKKNSVVADNTVYFPGWKAYVDNKEMPIEFQDQNWRGLITFPVSEGVHEVRVVFTETRSRLVADAISLSALLFLCGLSIFLVLRRYEKK